MIKALLCYVVLLVCLVQISQAKNCSENCSNGFFCCMDMCCVSVNETCCADKDHGSICCIAESSYCCPPSGIHASHCCPRWNVCCNEGRYGCCDPSTRKATESNFAYALFVLQKYFAALKIDLSTGAYTETPVLGFNDWDEIARVFTYDPVNNLFYLLQTNFLTHADAHQRDIILYTVDPTTGSAVAKTVQGCTESGEVDVPGFAYNPATKQILMSTYFLPDNTTVGYNFYTLDPDTAIATLKSQYESQEDSYVGWFDAVSSDNEYVYRLGYQNVINQTNSGLGVTCLSASTATTTWNTSVPVPPNHDDFYLSLSLSSSSPSGDSMLSLAADALGNLNLVQWRLGGEAQIIASFSNAHNTPIFGPIVEYVPQNQTYYSALIVKDAVVSAFDRWSVVLTDLGSQAAPREIELSPILLAKLESAAAFGIPA